MEEKEYIAKSAQISYLRMAFGLENYNLKIPAGIHVATYGLHVPKQEKATSVWSDLVKTTRKCKIQKRNAHQLAPIILLLHLDAEKLLIKNDSLSTFSTTSQRLCEGRHPIFGCHDTNRSTILQTSYFNVDIVTYLVFYYYRQLPESLVTPRLHSMCISPHIFAKFRKFTPFDHRLISPCTLLS